MKVETKKLRLICETKEEWILQNSKNKEISKDKTHISHKIDEFLIELKIKKNDNK